VVMVKSPCPASPRFSSTDTPPADIRATRCDASTAEAEDVLTSSVDSTTAQFSLSQRKALDHHVTDHDVKQPAA
jgi:hypothetical protein